MADESYEDEVRVDSIIELTEILTRDIKELAQKHGSNDPRLIAVLVSGIVGAIQRIAKLYPTVPYLVASMLTENIVRDSKK